MQSISIILQQNFRCWCYYIVCFHTIEYIQLSIIYMFYQHQFSWFQSGSIHHHHETCGRCWCNFYPQKLLNTQWGNTGYSKTMIYCWHLFKVWDVGRWQPGSLYGRNNSGTAQFQGDIWSCDVTPAQVSGACGRYYSSKLYCQFPFISWQGYICK